MHDSPRLLRAAGCPASQFHQATQTHQKNSFNFGLSPASKSSISRHHAQALRLDGAIETEELKTTNAPLKSRRSEIQARLAVDGPRTRSSSTQPAAACRRVAEYLHQAIKGENGEEAPYGIALSVNYCLWAAAQRLRRRAASDSSPQASVAEARPDSQAMQASTAVVSDWVRS